MRKINWVQLALVVAFAFCANNQRTISRENLELRQQNIAVMNQLLWVEQNCDASTFEAVADHQRLVDLQDKVLRLEADQANITDDIAIWNIKQSEKIDALADTVKRQGEQLDQQALNNPTRDARMWQEFDGVWGQIALMGDWFCQILDGEVALGSGPGPMTPTVKNPGLSLSLDPEIEREISGLGGEGVHAITPRE